MANATHVLLSSTTLGSTAASVTLSSIPSTYTDLLLQLALSDTNSGAYYSTFSMIFNNDTASNYSWSHEYVTNGGGLFTGSSGAAPSIPGPYTFAAQATNVLGNGEIYLPNYATSNTSKQSFGTYIAINPTNSSTTSEVAYYAGLYRSSSAITSIKFTAGSTFAIGSTFNVYGINNS